MPTNSTKLPANRFTILLDGGFLLMSRLFAFEKGFAVDNTEAQKKAAAQAFKETMSQTLSRVLNMFPDADNIVLMSEGGSWRKNLPIPDQLEDVTYKGHREKKPLDWNAIYKAYNEFAKNCEATGITVSQHSAIEGDDWAWYWSRRLNAEGTNVLIWTSDCDLKQLVQVYNNCFTAWYNDKAGLVFPKAMEWPDDPMEAMINPPFQSPFVPRMTRGKKVTYINPDLIVINKILCGDAGDNIKSVFRFKKNGRTYRFADSDYKRLIEVLGIDSMKRFLALRTRVAQNIAEIKKFADQGADSQRILEMIEYNTDLVWLNEAVLPDTVTSSMVQTEYKVFDVDELRRNNTLLTNRAAGMAEIFAGAQ